MAVATVPSVVAQSVGLQHVPLSAAVHVVSAQSVVEASSMRPFAPSSAQKVSKSPSV